MAIQGDGSDMTWGNLSETSEMYSDLLIQILLRLPVVSMLRFKSVCKAWYVLFNSSMFVQHHARVANSSAKITNLLSLFIHTQKTEGNGHTFSLFRDRSCENPTLKELNPPFGCHSEDIQVVGSINGLVCLKLCTNISASIVMWNPATRKHSQIPNPQLLLASDERESIGFAYDEKTDSYKVIRILYSKVFTRSLVSVKVEIYSTGTNTWRTTVVDDFPWLVAQKTCGAVVNGSPYWYAVGCREQDSVCRQFFLWFDPSEEAFRFHPLQVGRIWCLEMSFARMGDHPVAFCCEYETGRATSINMWKLNKCEDGEGGDLIYLDELMIKPVSCCIMIVGFGRNGEIIVLDEHDKLLTYDPRSTEIKYLPGCGSFGSTPKVYDYTESLVSPLIS